MIKWACEKVAAGLAKVIRRLYPIATIKGND
jgi:hypothetical protein